MSSFPKENLPWEMENGKEELEHWLIQFLPKLKRTSTRTNSCRLISSIDRIDYKQNWNAYYWQYVRFNDDEGEIFNRYCVNVKNSKETFKLTGFQKMLLESDPALMNEFIGRWDILEEAGEWILSDETKSKLISEGGEALVFSEKFEELVTAVRVQIFDPFLFTDQCSLESLSWKIHLGKGKGLS
jgi:hypothetical protein